jgi:hypothetical protein
MVHTQLTLKPRCRACGGEGSCDGTDIGGSHYYRDYFRFWCSCGRVEAHEEYQGQVGQETSDSVSRCPYCGIVAAIHGDVTPPPDVQTLTESNPMGILRERQR